MLHHLFLVGEFTQLEWIDFAARSLLIDGLVFDVRHFPRLDGEYLAELRKLCVDRGLTVAALAVDTLFSCEETGLELMFEIAGTIGTSIVITSAPARGELSAHTWREAAARGKAIARIAKRTNITVGIRNAADTLCTGVADLKRLTKDIDSSWLRFAPEVGSLSEEEVMALQVRTVISTTRNLKAPYGDPMRKGFLVLEQPSTDAKIPEVIEAVRLFSERHRRAGERLGSAAAITS